MANVTKITKLPLSSNFLHMENNLQERKIYVVLTINVFVLILVSSILRSPISAVGPVLNQIRISLALDNFQSSLLTSIPLLMFATCSVLVSKMTNKLSIQQFLLYALIILGVGLFVRISNTVVGLFLGSVFIGLGICIGNVVTPGYIKANFPQQIGLMTGVFSVAMSLTAALASGFSLRIGEWTGMGWRGSLGIWLVIAFLGIMMVAVELLFNKRKIKAAVGSNVKSNFAIFRSSQAWNISIFMGLQSVVYYSLMSWLPAVLNDFGMKGDEPGWVLFVIQIAMLPITFVGPILANRMRNQKVMMVFLCTLMFVSMLMFAWLKAESVYLSATLLGLSNGLSFSLSILFFSLRTKSSAHAIKLSGMAQSIGYLIAAFGPLVFGKLHDVDPSWNGSFYFLAGIIILMFFFGIKAAGNRFIED